MTRRSTLSDGAPLSITLQTFPAGLRSDGLTKRDVGSISVDQICWNAPFLARFLMTSCTGLRGHGKRTDSLSVPACSFASSVVTHSPKTEAKPCEKIGWLVGRPTTSKEEWAG